MSGNIFFSLIPSHSQLFISIPIPDPRFSLVLFPFSSHSHWLFPFPPASIPIQVDIFCQFFAALLLIIFWTAEIIKVKDMALLSWWALTVTCVTFCRSSRKSWCSTTWQAGSLPLTGNEKMCCFYSLPFPSSHSHSHETSLVVPIPMEFPWMHLHSSLLTTTK